MTQTVRGRRLPGCSLAALLALVLTGCWGPEKICSENEYPVRSIKHPEAGAGDCVRDGKPPPEGYETFPPGQEPDYYEDP